jgi:hypothetical protein
MRNGWGVSLAVVLALAAGNRVARADDQADMKALVAKAIKAAGGEKNLAKYRAVTMKMKGKFYLSDNGLPYTGELAVQYPGQQKITINFESCGQTFTYVGVVNKDKGWEKTGTGEAQAMGKDKLAEAKEQMYAQRLATLLPLRDKGVKLSPVGEVQVGDRAAVGIKVESKGHRDVNLYFDKKTHLLLKTETVAKAMGSDKEVPMETSFEDYKKTEGGVMRPTKMRVKQDGKKFVDVDEISDIQLLEKLDDSDFDKP